MDLNPLSGVLAALVMAVSAPAPAPAQPPVQAAPAGPAQVAVKGPGDERATVTAADLRDMHRENVTVAWGGGHTYAGALVTDILAEIGAASGARLHGPALDQVVIFKGRDGFIAILAVAETAITLKGQPVILADQEDGKPLNDKEGPFRLVIGGEAKPPRSVWGVTEIELRPIK